MKGLFPAQADPLVQCCSVFKEPGAAESHYGPLRDKMGTSGILI